MRATHEHEWEAAPGLPEALPAGEKILWQGCPNWAALAVHAFHVRKVSFYFALMMAWQIVSLHADGVDPLETFFYLMRSLTLSITAVCMLCMAAWWSAHTHSAFSVLDGTHHALHPDQQAVDHARGHCVELDL